MGSLLNIMFWFVKCTLIVKGDTFKPVNIDILFLEKIYLLSVYNTFCSQFSLDPIDYNAKNIPKNIPIVPTSSVE